MISPENRQLLEGLKSTNYGIALKQLLEEKYTELNNVKSCTSWEDTMARAKALTILDDVFSFMKDKIDMKNTTRYD